MIEFVIPLLIIGVFIFLNGIFVAAEFSIVAAPRTRVAQLADEGSSAAQRTLKILLEPILQNRYIATAQIGITIVSLGLGMYGERVIAGWLVILLHNLGSMAEAAAHTIASILSVSLLTYLHVVIGEMIPKTLALQSAEPTVLTLAQPMALLEKLFLPIVVVLNALGNGIIRLLGVPPPNDSDRLFTPEELEYIVEESFESGLLEPSEQLFIENIFDLQERTVEQVMTPRTHVVGIPVDASEETILRRVCETRKSRYPIYDGDLDQIAGILHIKDLARYRAHHAPGTLDIKTLARQAVFIPQSLQLGKMLFRFRREHIQFAIVLDEYGGTAGIVSMEDLVEEVVGEIQDEFDREIQPIEEIAEGVLRVRGDLILDELNQLYDLDIQSEDAYTVGGLVMTLLGRIPIPKDEIECNDITLEVESVERLAVQSVLLYLPTETGQGKSK
ncbi:MAG: hemolysin family protein [Anaerolineales bacterium]